MLGLNSFEKCLEVSSAETLMVATLDDFEEESWAILERLCEDLKKVALVIVVDEDLLSLKHVDILLHLHVDVA